MTQEQQQKSARQPVIFIGHGSPMNAIEKNQWSDGFQSLGKILPKPKAILSVSAHWYTSGTSLTSNAAPKTIHDFGGFPVELYEMQYPAAGDLALAKQVAQMLGTKRTLLTEEWGLDHGTWSVLHHLRPQADCPVVQLSVDKDLSAGEYVALGRLLAPLRDEGVLIMGSGNITHNLRFAFSQIHRNDFSIPVWAKSFDQNIADALLHRKADNLINAIDTEDGRMCHPTLDHYLPLLYAFGAAEGCHSVSFPITGFDLGSLSMRAVMFE
jgi:4,5-DOPA dioxygenase extradiol